MQSSRPRSGGPQVRPVRAAKIVRSRFGEPLNAAVISIDQLTGVNRDVTCEKFRPSYWNKRALLPGCHSYELSLPRSNPIEATLFEEGRKRKNGDSTMKKILISAA